MQAATNRIGIPKSRVFSRIGSREALQKVVIGWFFRRFLADVFVPTLQLPKGLPRLRSIVQRWTVRTRDVEARTGYAHTTGAFALDDCEGELRDTLLAVVIRLRCALRRAVIQAVEANHLQGDADADEMFGKVSNLAMGLLHDARFLRGASAATRAQAS